MFLSLKSSKSETATPCRGNECTLTTAEGTAQARIHQFPYEELELIALEIAQGTLTIVAEVTRPTFFRIDNSSEVTASLELPFELSRDPATSIEVSACEEGSIASNGYDRVSLTAAPGTSVAAILYPRSTETWSYQFSAETITTEGEQLFAVLQQSRSVLEEAGATEIVQLLDRLGVDTTHYASVAFERLCRDVEEALLVRLQKNAESSTGGLVPSAEDFELLGVAFDHISKEIRQFDDMIQLLVYGRTSVKESGASDKVSTLPLLLEELTRLTFQWRRCPCPETSADIW